MATVRSADERDNPTFEGKRVAILGYGNQGRAQAMNLRDSGVDLVIGQRQGASFDRAVQDGMPVVPVKDAAASNVVMFTLPDETAAAIYRAEVAPGLRPGATLLFTHGFNIHFGLISPPSNVSVGLVAPKGQAKAVRDAYLSGSGVPALVAESQGDPWDAIYAYAAAAGYTRSVLLETTFAEETETDLFGEQVVLCGGMIELMKAAFHTLVDAGYTPEIAYFECVQETKLIVDLIAAQGLESMRKGISDTAEWGGYQVGPRLVTDETRAVMRGALGAIRSGDFARGWVSEAEIGKSNLLADREAESADTICETGRRLRALINR